MDEKKVRRLLDKQDMLEILYQYCEAADKNDPANMTKFFHEDCVVQYVPTESIKRGVKQLSDHLFSFLGAVISGSHYIMNPMFEFVSDDEVLLACYMFSWQRFSGYPAQADAFRFGRYEIRFIRSGETWRMTHMKLLSAGEIGGDRIAEQMGRPFPPVLFAG